MEREVCSILRVAPQEYLALRKCILEGSRNLGYGDGVSTSHKFVIDLSRSGENAPFHIEGRVEPSRSKDNDEMDL